MGMPQPASFQFEWVPTTPSAAASLSGRAVVAGYEGHDHSPLWVIRARHEGDLVPGKLAIKHKAAYVPWNGKENFVSDIERQESNVFMKLTPVQTTLYPITDVRLPNVRTLRDCMRRHDRVVGHARCVTVAIPQLLENPTKYPDGAYVFKHNIIKVTFYNKILKPVKPRVRYEPRMIGVLCASPSMVRWIQSSNGCVPAGAVPAGNTVQGETLYVGRAKYQGSLTPGKLHPSHRMMYMSYGGQEIPHNAYEVLCAV
ncbi:hypothetical protein EVAR_101991_1 [Eumeta japonica]|uniref:Uncharacterized protein n=1 Tax=Eumeta variegata TaxID=151549 RepID=A0A4C1TT30_EUMVA|nr:hypothetical protein EVAR_101991_1 [Eumeta japonica]